MKFSSRIPALLAYFLVALAAGCQGNRPDGRELVIALAVFPGEAAHYRSFVGDFERREHAHVEIVAQSYDDILRALRAEASAGHGRLDIAGLGRFAPRARFYRLARAGPEPRVGRVPRDVGARSAGARIGLDPFQLAVCDGLPGG